MNNDHGKSDIRRHENWNERWERARLWRHENWNEHHTIACHMGCYFLDWGETDKEIRNLAAVREFFASFIDYMRDVLVDPDDTRRVQNIEARVLSTLEEILVQIQRAVDASVAEASPRA